MVVDDSGHSVVTSHPLVVQNLGLTPKFRGELKIHGTPELVQRVKGDSETKEQTFYPYCSVCPGGPLEQTDP